METLDPETLKRALALLTDQCNELEGRVQVLATALRDIEHIAVGQNDIFGAGTEEWNAVVHICQTGGVRTAMGAA